MSRHPRNRDRYRPLREALLKPKRAPRDRITPLMERVGAATTMGELTALLPTTVEVYERWVGIQKARGNRPVRSIPCDEARLPLHIVMVKLQSLITEAGELPSSARLDEVGHLESKRLFREVLIEILDDIGACK